MDDIEKVAEAIVHLSYARVRKKNLNRITKQVQRNMKRMVNKNEDT